MYHDGIMVALLGSLTYVGGHCNERFFAMWWHPCRIETDLRVNMTLCVHLPGIVFTYLRCWDCEVVLHVGEVWYQIKYSSTT